MTNRNSIKIVITAISCFFLVNCFWIFQDNRLPYIGDDARWLQETNNLAVTLKAGDISGFANRWENMFILNTNSFPRTPLFTLLSVPVFMLIGPNQKAALVMNLVVFAVASYPLYLLVLDIFAKDKRKYLLGLVTVVLFNLMPGFYGMARLYMSEVLQALFVILLTWILWRNGKSRNVWLYLLLGVLVALGLLLRFILPVYLVVPVLVFLYQQWRSKYNWRAISARLGLFAVGFLPLAATWYAKNLGTYWEFMRYTSSGPLAEITSLGPVWSPVTWFRFWKVIALWHYGWPMLAVIVLVLVTVLIIKRKQIFAKWSGIKALTNSEIYRSKNFKPLLYVCLAPLPALLATTFSLNKTARYFLPAEFFWVIPVAFLIVIAINSFTGLSWFKRLHLNTGLVYTLVFLVCGYGFLQSVLVFLPHLPATNYITSAGTYLKQDPNEARYAFLLQEYQAKPDMYLNKKFYLVPEEVRFNDAEIIWYFTQQGININTLGEFSSYTDLNTGEQKITQADVLVLNTAPDIAAAYLPKYQQLIAFIAQQPEWQQLAAKDFGNGAKVLILMRNPNFALLNNE